MRFLLPAIVTLTATMALADDKGHSHAGHDHPKAHGHSHDHSHDHGHDHGDESSHKASLGDVHLVHAWTAATEADEAFVFVEIANEGTTPVTLLGAEADIAQSVDLVGFQMTNGTASYASMPKLPIAAGAHMDLAPNAAAFRMTGVSAHLHHGDEFEMHVTFDTGEVEMMVQVEKEGATQHSHAGHNH